MFRSLSTIVSQVKPQICIVGSGPAGFYAAQYIANRLKDGQIDIFERLPVPFGLVRFGVAPDHFNLKKCINTFTKTAQLENVRFLGNINLGRDVNLKQLREAYHIVLLAYGVDDCKKLNIPGESLLNIHSAKNFVGWYNGVPWDKNLNCDLTGEKAVIFGHGNVAIDVARILLSSVDVLKSTDITEYALEALSRSKVREVSLIGRRGPLQVSFTTKELRELLNLKGCSTVWRSTDLRGVAEMVPHLVKPRKRLTELIVNKFQEQKINPDELKQLKMLFLRSPKEFLGDNDVVSKVKLIVNELEGDDFLRQKAVATNEEEIIDANLVVNSIGYKSIQADPDIPFNIGNGVVTNHFGKVGDGLYAAGWLANGASGVLLNTMEHAFGVASNILKDFEKGFDRHKPGFGEIEKTLRFKNVQIVKWADWLKIDEWEKIEGAKVNKPREKIVDIEKMLEIAST